MPAVYPVTPAVCPLCHACRLPRHARRLPTLSIPAHPTLSFPQFLAGIQRKGPGRPAPGRPAPSTTELWRGKRPRLPVGTGMTQSKILRFAQNDRRRDQNDRGLMTCLGRAAYSVSPVVSPYPVIPAAFSGNPREGHRIPAATRATLRRRKKPWIPVYTGMTWGGKRKAKGKPRGPLLEKETQGGKRGEADSGGGEILRFAQNDRRGDQSDRRGMTQGKLVGHKGKQVGHKGKQAGHKGK